MATYQNICSIYKVSTTGTLFVQCNTCGIISHTACVGTDLHYQDYICNICYSFPFHSVADTDDFIYKMNYNVSDIHFRTRPLKRLNIQDCHSAAAVFNNLDLDPDVNFFVHIINLTATI